MRKRLSEKWATLAVALGCVAAALPTDVRAQQSTPPAVAVAPPGARVIAGVVVDTADVPVDSVEIVLGTRERNLFSDNPGAFRADRRTYTNKRGEFRFTGVGSGDFEVRARRLGYAPQLQRMTMTPDGVGIRFEMIPLAQALAARVTSVLRGGLSGVIGDSTYQALPGAKVKLLASDKSTVTDSAGQFWLDVKPGKHMISISRPGFLNKLLSVSIPNDSGRKMIVWLTPGRPPNYDAAFLAELAHRMAIKRPSASLFTREDIERMPGVENVQALAQMGVTSQMRRDCEGSIDGKYIRPLYSIVTDDVESVEVYPAGSLPDPDGRMSRTSPNISIRKGLSTKRPSAPVPTCPIVIIWMKQ